MQISKRLAVRTKRVHLYPVWAIADAGLSIWPLHHIFNRFRKHKFGPIRPIERGGDEWGNSSLMVTIPLICGVDFFYGKMDRSKWFLSGASGDDYYYVSPDFSSTATIPLSTWAGAMNAEDPFDWVFDHHQVLDEATVLDIAVKIEKLDDED